MAIQTKTMKVKSDTALAETTTTIRDTVTFDTSKLPNGITYKGLKAVLSFADPIQWNRASTYDSLTVVWDDATHASYASKRPVPQNIELTNEFYWFRTADLDAQIEMYRQEVQQFDGRITANAQSIAAETARAENAELTLKNGIFSLASFDGETNEDKFVNALNTVESGTIICGKVNITKPYIAVAKDYRKIKLVDGTFNFNINEWFSQSQSTFNSVPAFSNCHLIGNGNTIFDSRYNCVGAMFDGCYFDNVCVFNSDSKYAQSLYVLNCNLNPVHSLVKCTKLYDFKMCGTRVESANGILIEATENESILQGSVSNCLIEGRTDVVMQFKSAYMLTVDNCYFEANASGLINQTNTVAVNSIKVHDCAWFAGSADPQYMIKLATSDAGQCYVYHCLTNIKNSRYLVNKAISNMSKYSMNSNYNYSHEIKNFGYAGRQENFIGLYNSTFNADTNDVEIIINLDNLENYSNLTPFYIVLGANYGSSTAYQGYAILRISPRTYYDGTDSAIKTIIDVVVIDSCNNNSKTKNTSVTAIAEIDNDAYNAIGGKITVKVKGFANKHAPKVALLDPFKSYGFYNA